MRVIANLVVLAIVLAAVAFLSAPVFAFYALRSAAGAQDVQGVAQLVDYAAMRAALRPQLSDRPDALAPPPAFLEDPIGAVRRQLEAQDPTRSGPDVDAYLTPDALLGLTLGEGRYAARSDVGTVTTEVDPAPTPRPRHWGLNRARMAVVDEGGTETVFTWERRGLFRWVLVHVGLPEGATPTTGAPAP